MTARRVLQLVALAAIAASIYLMQPEKTDSFTPLEQPGESFDLATAPPIETPALPAPSEQAAPSPAQDGAPVGAIMTREIPGDPGEPPIVPALRLEKGEQPWEKRVNQVLDSASIRDTDKARLLLEMLPGLPVEGREATAEHAITRLDDADYRHAQNVLTNPATYPPALAVLWGDLMARPESIALPTLLTVARNSSHPYAESARENLDLLLGQDFGTDWPRWEAAIREKLAKEPKR